MIISDYQISNVIRTYVKSVRSRVDQASGEEGRAAAGLIASDEGMRRMVFERIEERMTQKLKKHETE